MKQENRPERRQASLQHQAIEHMRQSVVEGYEWCASIDLQRFSTRSPMT